MEPVEVQGKPFLRHSPAAGHSLYSLTMTGIEAQSQDAVSLHFLHSWVQCCLDLPPWMAQRGSSGCSWKSLKGQAQGMLGTLNG